MEREKGVRGQRKSKFCLKMCNSTLIGIGSKGLCSIKMRKAVMMENSHICKCGLVLKLYASDSGIHFQIKYLEFFRLKAQGSVSKVAKMSGGCPPCICKRNDL